MIQETGFEPNQGDADCFVQSPHFVGKYMDRSFAKLYFCFAKIPRTREKYIPLPKFSKELCCI